MNNAIEEKIEGPLDPKIKAALSRLEKQFVENPLPPTDPSEKAAEKAKEIEIKKKVSRVPSIHWDMKVGELDMAGDFGRVLRHAREKIGAHKPMVMALIGKRGNGKTQISVELIRMNICEMNLTASYISAKRLFMTVKEGFMDGAQKSELKIIDGFSVPRFLVIDELAKTPGTKFESDVLEEIVDARYYERKPTLIISNSTLEQFSVSAGDSIISRINGTGGILECNWESFREKAVI